MVPYADGRPRLRRPYSTCCAWLRLMVQCPQCRQPAVPAAAPVTPALTSAMPASLKPFGPLHEAGPATAPSHD